MEPDDLLCSRNARSRTPLVGRAQMRFNVLTPPREKGGGQSKLGETIVWCSFDARNRGSTRLPLKMK